MYPYLYLAPRGQAKTYEAAAFADSRSRTNFKTSVFVNNERAANYFTRKLTEKPNLTKVLFDLSEAESVDHMEVRVFDEFDFLFKDFDGEFKIRPTDRFYGTPLFKRNIANLPKDDILVKILAATNGHYHGRMWAECWDSSILKRAKNEIPKEQFELEFLGNFWEVE